MKFEPLRNRILVECIEGEDMTSGGIVIPDIAKEKSIRGKVVAVGKGKVGKGGKRIALDIKMGDEILFNKYGCTDIRIKDKWYISMSEADVLVVIE